MPRNGRQRVVLVVEDDQPIGELLASAISEEPGYCAIHVSDSAAAIDAVKQVKPDVFVVDVTLPGMSGLELYDRLRRDEATKDVPVLFETGGGTETANELKKRGIAAYVKKPFDVNKVVAFVKYLASPRRQAAATR